MADDTLFIVAEISRNWINGKALRPGTLCSDFEHVLDHNLARGYTLVSFQLHRMMVKPDEMNETIIAVFQHTHIAS